MSASLISHRYAKALFEVLREQSLSDLVLGQLAVVADVFEKEPSIAEFFSSPMASVPEKVECLKKTFSKSEMHALALDFLSLLVENNRVVKLPQILKFTQSLVDEAHGVCRGTVKSASALDLEERKAIELQLKKVVQKQVIVSYQVDPSLIGGLVAQVGSYTLDDSIVSHLNRLNEQITRSI